MDEDTKEILAVLQTEPPKAARLMAHIVAAHQRKTNELLELVKDAMPYMEKYAIYDGGWAARARDILPRPEGSDASEEPKEATDART